MRIAQALRANVFRNVLHHRNDVFDPTSCLFLLHTHVCFAESAVWKCSTHDRTTKADCSRMAIAPLHDRFSLLNYIRLALNRFRDTSPDVAARVGCLDR